MSKFAEKAQSFSGTIQEVDGKSVTILDEDKVLTFTVEGDVASDLSPGHEVTVVTWGSTAAVRVVNHSTNVVYRPYYNPNPQGGPDLAEASRSPADEPEVAMGLFALLPAVALATLYQSIPIYGWLVTYRMVTDADGSVRGTVPQYQAAVRRYFVFFVLLAFVGAGLVVSGGGGLIKAALVYMTLLYLGTFLLMRTIFRGIEEIDAFARHRAARRHT